MSILFFEDPACQRYAKKASAWYTAKKQRIALTDSHLGKFRQNADVERLRRPVGHEWLGAQLHVTVAVLQDVASAWLWTYNNERPNMGNGGLTPRGNGK